MNRDASATNHYNTTPSNKDGGAGGVSATHRRLGEQAMDARSNAAKDRIEMLDEVRRGMRSVRNASLALNWTDEEVQMAVWGEVRQ